MLNLPTIVEEFSDILAPVEKFSNLSENKESSFNEETYDEKKEAFSSVKLDEEKTKDVA